MKTRQTRTIYFRIGLRWYWRVISRRDDSLIAQGSARKKSECEAATKNIHDQIQHQQAA